MSVKVKTYTKERQKEIIDGLNIALRSAAVVVENQAKENLDQTPPAHPQVRTARLRASVSHNWAGSGMANGKVEPPAKPEDGVSQPSEVLTMNIGTNVYYGKYLEHGTPHHPAYPWLFPALEASKSEITEILKKAGAKNIIIG